MPLSPRANTGFPRSGKATDCNQHRRLRHDQAFRQIEIAPGFTPGRRSSAACSLFGEQHRARGSPPASKEQGQHAEAVEIFIRCAGKIAVEQRGCRRGVVETDEVHQRERQIVEDHPSMAMTWIEFDGVEQQRLAVDQRNVGEMKIAVAAPDETLPGALLEQGSNPGQTIVAKGIRADRWPRPEVRAPPGISRCCGR